MKAKKLVTLALPIMLLGGCVTNETSKKEEPKKEETSKVEKESKTTEKDTKKEDNLTVAKGEDKKSNSSNSSKEENPLLKGDNGESLRIDSDKAKGSSSSSSNNNSNSSSSSNGNFEESNSMLRGENGESLRINSNYAPNFKTSDSVNAETKKYMSNIITYSTEVANTLDLVDKIANSSSKDYAQKKSELTLSLGGAKVHLGKLRDLKAPTGFEGDQKNIVKAMDLYGKGFQLMIDALEDADETKVDKAITEVQAGNKYWMDAINSIDRKTR
ncbi:hypothetical protein COJ48_30290 [Bacillus cereus]|nr:hypothetical protein COJ48_30290 [Bacillus cereus]